MGGWYALPCFNLVYRLGPAFHLSCFRPEQLGCSLPRSLRRFGHSSKREVQNRGKELAFVSHFASPRFRRLITHPFFFDFDRRGGVGFLTEPLGFGQFSRSEVNA